jgi:hypothetical protein
MASQLTVTEVNLRLRFLFVHRGWFAGWSSSRASGRSTPQSGLVRGSGADATTRQQGDENNCAQRRARQQPSA